MPERNHIKLPKSISNTSTTLIAKAAIDKGLSVEPVARNIFIVEGNGKTEIFELTMASSISHIAKTISWDKQLTKQFFEKYGVPTPKGLRFRPSDVNKAARFMSESSATSFVVKPTNGVLGTMVFMNVDTEEKLKEKCELIPKKYKRLLIEEQISGTECRYFVVGDKVVAVAERKPANVIGDGESTVHELIERKNKSREGHLALIPLKMDGEVIDVLSENGYTLDSVPDPGVKVILKRVSNISQGGDSVDITDEVHDDLKELAVAALKAIPTLSYAGLDIIADDHRSSLDGQNAVVLEVNWHPMLRMHHAPAIGTPRDVAGEIIDHLFFR